MRHAFITGASSGLGRALAIELASRGYDLTLLARREALLAELKNELKASGRKVLTVVADVVDWEAMEAAVAKAEAEIGPIDVMYANAGVSGTTLVDRFNALTARHILEINVLGVMHAAAAVVPYFKKRGKGQIVGVSSLVAYLGMPAISIYGASKAAASSYLDGIRIELAPNNIRVTTVCPGFIKTAMTNENGDLPLVMDPLPAARLIVRRVEKGCDVVNFPLPLYWGLCLLKLLPRFLLKKILGLSAKSMIPK